MNIPWRTVGIVVVVVLAINLVSYFVARRALAQPAAAALGDGGPTGTRRAP